MRLQSVKLQREKMRQKIPQLQLHSHLSHGSGLKYLVITGGGAGWFTTVVTGLLYVTSIGSPVLTLEIFIIVFISVHPYVKFYRYRITYGKVR